MFPHRLMQFQINGLEEPTHRIPKVRTRQWNRNSPVDLLAMCGRQLLFDLSGSGLVEGTCCTHHLLVVTRPLETFNPSGARQERAFKFIRGCRPTDGGSAATATCVLWDAAGAVASAFSSRGLSSARTRPRGEQPHRDRCSAGRRWRHHVGQRDLAHRTCQPHRDRRRSHGGYAMERRRDEWHAICSRRENRFLRLIARSHGRVAEGRTPDTCFTGLEQRRGRFRRPGADTGRLVGHRKRRPCLVLGEPLHRIVEHVLGLKRLPRAPCASPRWAERDVGFADGGMFRQSAGGRPARGSKHDGEVPLFGRPWARRRALGRMAQRGHHRVVHIDAIGRISSPGQRQLPGRFGPQPPGAQHRVGR